MIEKLGKTKLHAWMAVGTVPGRVLGKLIYTMPDSFPEAGHGAWVRVPTLDLNPDDLLVETEVLTAEDIAEKNIEFEVAEPACTCQGFYRPPGCPVHGKK